VVYQVGVAVEAVAGLVAAEGVEGVEGVAVLWMAAVAAVAAWTVGQSASVQVAVVRLSNPWTDRRSSR